MSIMEKCIAYSEAHNGALPPFDKMDELVSEQLREYLNALSGAVIPEFNDRAILTAAYKLVYEARYNMLETHEKTFCDQLVQRARVISTERAVEK